MKALKVIHSHKLWLEYLETDGKTVKSSGRHAENSKTEVRKCIIIIDLLFEAKKYLLGIQIAFASVDLL